MVSAISSKVKKKKKYFNKTELNTGKTKLQQARVS